MIKKAEIFAKKKYKLNDSKHRWSHVEKVMDRAMNIAKYFKVDYETLKLAIIFHDIDYKSYATHVDDSVKVAEQFLKKQKFPKRKINKIKKVMLNHSGPHRRKFGEAKLIEGKIIYDADKSIWVNYKKYRDKIMKKLYLKETKRILVYEKIHKLATPYYKKGRQGDEEHHNWLYDVIPNFIDKKIDPDILIPVILLHDIGYSKVKKGADPFKLDIRKFHSEEGAKLAEKILKKINYPKGKISKIKKLVLRHDNWAFGDTFKDNPTLLLFHNFDFMWMASEKGFDIVKKIMKQNRKDFYEQIKKF
ncbi:HD domain-containing protein, partial [Nanoarchaeota archaeon]